MEFKAKLFKTAKTLYSKYTSLFYFVLFYAFLLNYHTIVTAYSIGEWSVDSATYTHHLVDYSFGFCTKFLPGAIYHLFFKEVYHDQLNVYLRILVLIFFAALSFFMAKAMTLQKTGADRKTLLVILAFYLTGPCTFAIFTQQLGMLDLYWMLFGALFFFAVRNRFLKYFIPVLFVLTLLVHFSSLVSYIVLFVLILAYESLSNEHKGAYKAVLAVSATVTILLFLYFLLYESTNLKYDMNGFNAEISRRDNENYNYFIYFDYALYNFFDSGSGVNKYVEKDITAFFPTLGPKLSAPLAKVIATVLSHIQFNMTIYTSEQIIIIAACLVTLAPILVLFAMFWAHMIKGESLPKKLLYTAALLQFYITYAIGLVTSVDSGRWCTHAFLVQFTFVIYVVLKENQISWFKTKLSKLKPWQIVLYLSVYGIVQVPAYC